MRFKELENFTNNNSEIFEAIINDQKYSFLPLFVNPESDVVALTKPSVRRFVINDNVLETFHDAEIDIIDTGNAFERTIINNKITEFDKTASNFKGYNFRGDGRDLFFIEIIPLASNKNITSTSQKYKNNFGYRNIYSCVDVEFVDQPERTLKRLKLKDYDKVLLSQRKSFFSSIKLLDSKNKKISQISNKDREAPTGKCLKKIITDGLLETDSKKLFETSGDGETKNFEDGLSNIFYSSPNNNSYLDDLQYVYKNHVSNSSKKDFSFLKKENFTNFYTLESAYEKFTKAFNKRTNGGGRYNLEKLVITGATEKDSNKQSSIKIPDGLPSFGEYSDVINYNFFNTSELLTENSLNTKEVHSYNFNNKNFNIEKNDSNIIAGKNNFTENYVKDLKGKNASPYPNFVLNETKKLNLSYENVFSLYGEDETIRRNYGLNKLLKNALFTNLAVQLTVKGQMFRKSGRFFSLDRSGDYPDNKFDNKFLGIYFIINVQHEFKDDDTYLNNIIAVKTYHFDDPKFNENTK